MDEIITRLTGEQTRAAAAVASLRALRQQAAASVRKLEGPNAVLEQIDFFVTLFDRNGAELARLAAELPAGLSRAHIDAIAQVASNSAAEQRRMLLFRDKWINKPLPYEEMRVLLNGIASTTRDQIDAFRSLGEVAASLDADLREREQKDGKAFDRRALFNRLFKPPGSG